jgi:hypothetical protein
VQGYVTRGHQEQVNEALPEANLTRIFANLDDAWRAEHPGQKMEGDGRILAVLDGGAYLRFGWATAEC